MSPTAPMAATIRRVIELHAPIERVWRALTDHREFGQWFGVQLDGPFVVGQVTRGRITHPDYQHVLWQVEVVSMQPQTLFAFRWHPYAVDPSVDYSSETPTLVEFRVSRCPAGTLLELTESGFEKLPDARRPEAIRMNEGGWTAQMSNIERHVAHGA